MSEQPHLGLPSCRRYYQHCLSSAYLFFALAILSLLPVIRFPLAYTLVFLGRARWSSFGRKFVDFRVGVEVLVLNFGLLWRRRIRSAHIAVVLDEVYERKVDSVRCMDLVGVVNFWLLT